MPIIKHTFIHAKVNTATLLERLPKLSSPNLDDGGLTGSRPKLERGALVFWIAHTLKKEVPIFDREARELTTGFNQIDKVHHFRLLGSVLEMPSIRSGKVFGGACELIGMQELQMRLMTIDLYNWLKAALMNHSYSQLGSITLNGVRLDDHFIGKLEGKSVDNRTHMEIIEKYVDSLRSVSIGWFDDGLKYRVTATSGGKLEVACKDTNILPQFYENERRVYLEFANQVPFQTELTDFTEVPDDEG